MSDEFNWTPDELQAIDEHARPLREAAGAPRCGFRTVLHKRCKPLVSPLPR